MQEKNGRSILVIENEVEVRGYLEVALECLGYSVELAQDGKEALARLQSSRTGFAAVLLDIKTPYRAGIDTLHEIRQLDAGIPVIVVSGESAAWNIVTAMKNGGTDFLCKPVTREDLRKAIARALEVRATGHMPPSQKSAAVTGAFWGNNPRMKEIQGLIEKVGWSEPSILIQGETGSGKEVVVRELHARSARSQMPLVKLNCAALPSELVESELFGYERGAFTGAFQRKAGMFEMANGGTILLDEIGDMDVRLQAKLLQVLQDHEFQRVGGKETIKVDVRVLAATHRDLERAIAERTFREDLYYRLNVINIVLPPLRERGEDIIPLAEFLMRKHASPNTAIPAIPDEMKQAMMSHRWPGNVRELENFIRRFLILGDPHPLVQELQAKSMNKSRNRAATPEAPTATVPMAERPTLEQLNWAKQQAETEAILAALNSTRWNRKQAAMLLKVDYKALLYKMKKLSDNLSSSAVGDVLM